CLFYLLFVLFFFNTAATTEIYTLSLHDALPISTIDWPSHQPEPGWCERSARLRAYCRRILARLPQPSILHHWRLPFLLVSRKSQDRKSTRLNSSHLVISYAVFCLKKKKTKDITR